MRMAVGVLSVRKNINKHPFIFGRMKFIACRRDVSYDFFPFPVTDQPHNFNVCKM